MSLLVVIAGPTASGKTSASVEVATALGTEVMSFDSRQFYKEMSIGTARPTEDELKGVPHHFLGDRSIHEAFNAFDYEKEATSLLKQLFKKHPVVIATGGTGLYMRALCEGLDPIPSDQAVKTSIEHRLESEGLESLVSELREVDPEFCTYGDLQNPIRVIRALEVFQVSGKPLSEWHTEHKPQKREFDILKLGIHWDRAELYARIDKRVDIMMEQGLLDEVRSLLPYKHLRTLNTVGYQEIFDHMDGKTSLDEAVELVKRNSRRYAKRQLTWFRKEDMTWFSPEEFSENALRAIRQRTDS